MKAWLLWAAWLVPAAAAAEPPRLLLVVVVDQMRPEYLDSLAAEYRGGLKTLREGGAVIAGARHPHVPTETAPGHAAVLTGQLPARHGIVGNDWWDRERGAEVYNVSDSVHGAGPEHLLGYTLGDALKARDPRSRVVSVSLKDRAAILMGGRKADAAVWFDRKGCRFTTSSYYPPAPWLERYNRRLKAKNGPLAGLSDCRGIAAAPAGESLVADLALELARRHRLGSDKRPDILAVSFSSVDYVGHKHGLDGPPMREQLLALDAALGRLLGELSRRAGAGRIAVMLTADHGAALAPAEERGRAAGMRRVHWDELEKAVEKRLQFHLPAGERWVHYLSAPNLYLNRKLARAKGLDWTQFLRNAARWTEEVDGVEAVYIPGEWDEADRFTAVYRASYHPERSGDLLVRLAPTVVLHDSDAGTSHGSPYDDDAEVPLVFWGPAFKPGRYPGPAVVPDLAATAAQLLALPFPSAGEVRREALLSGE